jgi:hypothetical protein
MTSLGIRAASAATGSRVRPLMQHAFSPDTGPLTDPNAEPGERVGIMSL